MLIEAQIQLDDSHADHAIAEAAKRLSRVEIEEVVRQALLIRVAWHAQQMDRDKLLHASRMLDFSTAVQVNVRRTSIILP